LASLGHLSKFQRVSHLGFITAPTSLDGFQPHFAQCLAVFWAGTLCMHFWGSCPLAKFCQVQNSLCVQVLRSILAAVLRGTRAVCVSQALRLGIFTRQGGHPVRHWAVEQSSLNSTTHHFCIHRVKWRHSNLWSHYELYVAPQHGVLCEVICSEDLSRYSNEIEPVGSEKCP